MSDGPVTRAPKKDAELFREAVQRHQNGDFQTAERLYRQLIEIAPGHPETNNLLGVLLCQTERSTAGRKFLQKAVELEPGHQDAWFNLGNAYKESGDRERALEAFDRAIAVAPEHVDARLNRATTLRSMGRTAEAGAELEQLESKVPGHPLVLNSLGNVRLDQGRAAEAERYFRRGIEIQPDNPQFWFNLGGSLLEQGRYDEALDTFVRVTSMEPAFADAWRNIAAVHEEANRLDEAEAAAREGLQHSPTNTDIKLILAKCVRRRGAYADAIDTLKELFAQSLEREARTKVLYELGRCADFAERPAEAFGYFTQANDLSRSGWLAKRPGPNAYLARLDTLLNEYGPDWKPDAAVSAKTASQFAPAFLIGFPRSGTTLLEQILLSHPRVTTLSETSLIDDLRTVVENRHTSLAVAIASLSADETGQLRASYLQKAGPIPSDGILIDKLPLNIVETPIIHHLFPEAKIILALRHPMDVCLSCFMQEFQPNHAMSCFFNLDDTADLYERVMTLWHNYCSVLPLDVHTLKYESVVEDFDATIGKLLGFLELEWDDKVRAFAETARAGGLIRTPSYHQVSEPIYQRAIGRWRRYQDQLGPIAQRLAPFVERFGYQNSAY